MNLYSIINDITDVLIYYGFKVSGIHHLSENIYHKIHTDLSYQILKSFDKLFGLHTPIESIHLFNSYNTKEYTIIDKNLFINDIDDYLLNTYTINSNNINELVMSLNIVPFDGFDIMLHDIFYYFYKYLKT